MSADKIALVAQAEKILNRTLAYQAAAAVHDLRDQLDLNVGELRLVVAPDSTAAPGCCRVICTIVSLASQESSMITPKAANIAATQAERQRRRATAE